jgi:hypothetical protein
VQVPDVPTVLPGTVATVRRWLAERVDHSVVVWRLERPRPLEITRAAGTLWWSMSSYALLRAPLEALIAGTPVPDPELSRSRIALGPEGEICGVDYDTTVAAQSLGRALHAMAGSVIGPLAEVCAASSRSLWAITSDALADCVLDITGRRADAEAVVHRLADDIGCDLPRPRFVTVAGRVFVRRSSCCLYFRSSRSDSRNCSSCPRRRSDQRRDLLAASVQCDR